METSAKNGFTNATDAADYLVKHGVPFRDAHGIIGQLVLYGIEHNKALDDFTLDEFKDFISDVKDIAIEEYWITGDVRPGREDEKWLNLILRKIAS